MTNANARDSPTSGMIPIIHSVLSPHARNHVSLSLSLSLELLHTSVRLNYARTNYSASCYNILLTRKDLAWD